MEEKKAEEKAEAQRILVRRACGYILLICLVTFALLFPAFMKWAIAGV